MPFYCSANGSRVVSLDLLIPYQGAPVVDIGTADGPAPSGAVAFVVGNLSLAMAVTQGPRTTRAGVFAGSATARLVGGAGGWARAVTIGPYRNPGGVMLSQVLRDLAAAAVGPSGAAERVRLAEGLDTSLGAFYVVENGAQAGRLLAQLVAAIGAVWWVDTKGITQIAATRPTSVITTASTIGDVSYARGRLDAATEDPRSWVPGASFTGVTVPGSVLLTDIRMHAASDGRLRIEALTA